MLSSKVWKIKGYEGTFSDEEIISLIKTGKLSKDDALSAKDIKGYIKIKDSIYEYYLNKEEHNETI